MVTPAKARSATSAPRVKLMLGVVAVLSLVIYVEITFAPRLGDFTTSLRHKASRRSWTNSPYPTRRPIDKFIPSPHLDLDATQIARQDAVRRAMQHAWSNYEKLAFGADEVAPVSGRQRKNVWGGIGVTLVDSLDTLYIMGMHDEFYRARDWVAKHMDFTHVGDEGTMISVFEIIIRQLGGLLSAYDLSQDDVFKHRAVELADLLLPAFSNGVFYTHFNMHTKDTYLPHHGGKLRYSTAQWSAPTPSLACS
ncbi:hypothetical protein DYB32_009717 [Aphanomyces invadans]|uniref:alpha-1,2-Mannosidase n=1 Tax=Aphanomyces invadans TaxID=157072 RepID=A0A418AI55_9STRA|nr:hypothetical protein DYB32_009717 [Aphanomyces invadans]